VQTDKTKESLVEINKELREILGSRPASQEELSKAQSNLTLKLPGSRETNDQVADSIATLIRFGLPDNYYETYPDKVRTLTRGDLADAAKTLIHPDHLVWVVVGDRTKIEAGVRELKIGEVYLMDADGNPLPAPGISGGN
jgi:zinc protease